MCVLFYPPDLQYITNLVFQRELPRGHTVLGVIGASDKTPLTVGTGNKEMHPVLLSLANIKAGVRMKATSHAFSLAGYLPIPKFQDVAPPVQAALSARVFHIALSIITQGLRTAATTGHAMPDPNGHIRICHPMLASWIADLPEQRLIACVLSNQSPTSLATLDQFGDVVQQPPRTREHTLRLIQEAIRRADPGRLNVYIREAALLGLNGVFNPFWRDWRAADPSLFLTPDALHAWHKFFFDHVIKWCINLLGGAELDRRMAALQRCVGVRHWPNGISKLKQCTGREHRDLEKIIVPIIAGAVSDNVMRAIRSIVEFIFHAQNIYLFEDQKHAMDESWREFHHFKDALILAGGRLGKNGPIPHFNIPKLEGMGRVTYNASQMGAPYQYTSDITERCHITHVKTPYRRSNKRNFHPQCCRYLDRVEKTLLFDLYTNLTYHRASLVNLMVDEASTVADHYPEATWLSHALPVGEYRIRGAAAKPSLFDKAGAHPVSDDLEIAFSVPLRPHYPRILVPDAALKFSLPDLHGALGDYFGLRQSHTARRGQRISSNTCSLPFTALNVWQNFRMQQRSSQDSSILLPTRTVQALAPTPEMPYGRCNTVLVRDDSGDGLGDSDGGGEFHIKLSFLFSLNIACIQRSRLFKFGWYSSLYILATTAPLISMYTGNPSNSPPNTGRWSTAKRFSYPNR